MSSVGDHLTKMREQRIAREKARLDKLRELNLKKYSNNETLHTLKPASSVSIIKTDVRKSYIPKSNLQTDLSKRPITAPINITDKNSAPAVNVTDKNSIINVAVSAKSSNYKLYNTKFEKPQIKRAEVRPWNFNVPPKIKPIDKTSVKHIGDTSTVERRNTVGDNFKKPIAVVKSIPNLNRSDKDAMADNKSMTAKSDPKLSRKSYIPKIDSKSIEKPKPKPKYEDLRKSIVPKPKGTTEVNPSRQSVFDRLRKIEPKPIEKPKPKPKYEDLRKSILPKPKSTTEVNPNRQSVFERLYQPKNRSEKTNITDSEKLKNDPIFLKKVILNSAMILNKRHTVFETKKPEKVPPRRSISAVHFRRISKNELSNCIHKWSSVGEKLDKIHLNEISEDAAVKEDKIVSAVRSERKKVTFQTPTFNFNTPKPEELRSRLQSWLQKRGKSIDSYHHLQCFGIHHLAHKEIKPLNLEATNFEDFDDENKENVPVDSDSDDGSYEDNMNNKKDDEIIDEMLKATEARTEAPSNTDKDSTTVMNDKWRRASCMSDCVTDMNETQESTFTTPSVETPRPVDELLLGALNDLTELLREGFDWEQSARWLRGIRERFPSAPNTAAYWECRAALEERRGDLPASVQCWEEAIAKGTERSVVEANLDQLLDKFMQLKLSPGGKARQPDPKLVDVKNVFKSTLIRFAVQQAKLRQSQEPKFTVTPVRRSARLSSHWSARRTPLQECTSVHQAGLLMQQPLHFVPNDKLAQTP